ncbi:helix-turn-helix transcriptional regulator [Flavobacterium zepuense]|uniref:Helix-turn-helix transcriptional regulator n=1 Tax=Flavobacterium zepuense TaxID=2593302 RepID=A0A552V8D0_9FLAO|nr:AraC family transcriptional regulator [Flavobacterium zepuense]TRW26724.1 helix-turn-helix transcriptional regulator [Flavobacterium zepuense]
MDTAAFIDEVICRINLPADVGTPKELTERDISFTYGYGRTSFKKISFSGVRLLYGKLRFKKPFPVKIENSEPFVEMYFSLTGCRRMVFTQNAARCNVASGHHNLFYIPDTEFYIEPAINDEENITLQIQFTEAYFSRFTQINHPLLVSFIENISKKQFSILSGFDLKITPQMYAVLDDIVHCEKEGIIKQLFIETSVLKLLQLQFEQFEMVFGGLNHPKIKDYDIEKLRRAKLLLDSNISTAWSLAELSRQTGLNDFKLKKGFKEVYGDTVFGYLHTQRMETAQKLLLDNSRSISEISEYCGYAYVQSFITAFKKKYGVTPEKFRK